MTQLSIPVKLKETNKGDYKTINKLSRLEGGYIYDCTSSI